MNRLAATLVALASSFAATAHAESDVQLWFEAGLTKRVTRRIDVSLDQMLRFDQDVSRVEAVMPEAAATYRFHRMFRMSVGYRFIYGRDGDGEMVLRNRAFIDARLRHDVGPVQLTYRLRFQEEVRGSFSPEDLRHTLRNKLEGTLKLRKRWDASLSGETFHRLGDGDAVHLRRIRLLAGISYDRKKHTTTVFYGIEVAQVDPTAPTPHIIGVDYAFAL